MIDSPSKPYSDRGAVVVTGVSSGIGRAIALVMIEAGYFVFGSVRRREDADLLSAAGGDRFHPVVFDVTNPDEIAQGVAEIERRLSGRGIAALVNNAGINTSGPFLHQPAEQFRAVMDVNFHGLVAVTRALLPLLGASDLPGRPPGRIVNIGSVQGIMSVPFMTAYAASKHAVEGFAQGLRRELIPFGIAVSTIEPNFTRSEMFAKAAVDTASDRYDDTRYAGAWRQFNAALSVAEAKAQSAESVARTVLAAIEVPRPRPRYPLDPIWHLGRFLPDRLFDRLIFKALGIAGLMQPPMPETSGR